MKKELADYLVVACDYSGLEYELRDDYSGRGMYGKTTYALVVSSALDLLKAVIEFSQVSEFEEIINVGLLNQDSMARDIIIY